MSGSSSAIVAIVVVIGIGLLVGFLLRSRVRFRAGPGGTSSGRQPLRWRFGREVALRSAVAQPQLLAAAVGPLGGQLVAPQPLPSGGVTYPVRLSIHGFDVWLTEQPDAGAETVQLFARDVTCVYATAVLPVTLPPIGLESMTRTSAGTTVSFGQHPGDPAADYGYLTQYGDPALVHRLLQAGLGTVLANPTIPNRIGDLIPLQRLNFQPLPGGGTQVGIQSLVLFSYRLNEHTVRPSAATMAAVLSAIQLATR